jgi:hypothetical protein
MLGKDLAIQGQAPQGTGTGRRIQELSAHHRPSPAKASRWPWFDGGALIGILITWRVLADDARSSAGFRDNQDVTIR